MIVIGVDVHKHSLTAVAVDELGAHALPVGWSAWREGAGLGALARSGTAVGARGLPARQPRPRAAVASRKRETAAAAAAADGAPASARPDAASRMRSTRSPSPAPLYASRASISHDLRSRSCAS
jgi:hypothetical protein